MEIKRLPVLDIWVDELDMDTAVRKVEDMVGASGPPKTILAVNPEKNLSVPRDPGLHELFRTAGLLIPDGIGVVLAARLLHGARISRVPGCDLMQKICGLAEKKDWPVYIYGAKPEVNTKAVQKLRESYPNLRIAGHSHGYVPPEGMDDLVRNINDSGALILFVAMGSPKQEKWMLDHMGRLTDIRVCQGVGGTLDIISGDLKRAPALFCGLGLEWLYRLISEPKRLKRQSYYPIFALKVLREKLGRLINPPCRNE